jgi:signal transduction histidine kinase/ligand-binding sensor domain-containing protein/DNA-binding response OmpR family regulator
MLSRLILSIICAAGLITLHAKDLPVRYIGIEQGLSNNAVTSIYQDHYGFMWFGTYDGLNRYDGYEFKIFRNSIGNQNSVISNNINCMEGDRFHNLWIGSQKGLVVYDQRKTTFTPMTYVPYGQLSPQNLTNDVLKIKAAGENYMMVGTQNTGLIVFEGSLQRGVQVPYPGAESPTEYEVTAIEYNGKGDVAWIFIQGKGLHTYNLKNRSIQLVNADIKDGRCLKFDVQDLLLLGNESGLYRYSIGNRSYTHNLLRVQTSVRDICMGNGNTFWIACDGTGVWTLPRGAAYASPYLSSSGELLVNSNAVYSIYKDQNGRKWIGTLRGGINLIEPSCNQFSHVSYNRATSANNLVEDFIMSFCEESNGDLWIGTDGAGLRHWDQKLNRYTEYKYNVRDRASIRSNFITNIAKDFENHIWVSTWYGGINSFDKETGTFKKYSLINPATNSSEENSWIVFEDKLKNLWVAGQQGAYLYNRSSDRFELFDDTLSNMVSLHEDLAGNLWGGNYNSLIRIDRVNKRHSFFKIGYPVRSIHEDKKHNLWVGTQDGGLLLLDRKTGEYKQYSTKDGLPNNTILRILEDKHGNLWLSTYKGLSKFDPSRLTFHNFSESDGLQSNQFSFNAALRLSTGEFLFGGIRGFNRFHPDSISSHVISPDLFISGLKINNVPADGSTNHEITWYPDQLNNLVLPYDSAVLSIDYIALEYSGNDKLNYAYILEGWDQGWNYVGKSRTANYSKLHEGEYIFKVKVRAADGNWTSESSLLRISVLPPWFRTWWAYSLYSLLIVLALLAYLKYARWHARLKYEMKLAHLENEKEKEVAEKKLAFFTNISHEFRTPLTLIIDPLKEVIKNPREPVTHKPLEIAYRNARRLLSLIDQLMLFRKADTGHDFLNLSVINIVEVCKEVFCCFSQTAIVRNIQFRFTAPEHPVEITGDYEKLEIVFFNLLSNAFKFTDDNGFISVRITESMNEVQVTVEDSGMGIPNDQIESIFDKYTRGSSSAAFSKSGFGIGLYMVKYFIELHKGKIECESEVNKGARFIATLEKNNPQLSANVVSSEPERNSELLKELFVQVDKLMEEPEPAFLTGQTANELVTEKKSILIIDDNHEITEYLELLFRDQYFLYKAENGVDGFKIVSDNLPDLVISDVHMAGMDGLQLCKKIKESPELAHIPVILLTGSSAEDTQLNGLEGGADDYITKPFNSELLLARVDNILKNRNLIQRFFFDQVTLKPNSIKVPAEYRVFLEHCIAVIEENMDKDDFSVTRFAREMGMSHSALYQKIRLVSGQTINNFIRSIRLRRAAVLMLRGDMQVKEAAFQVGLSDVKYFRQQFTRLFKMTPSQYIKKYRHSFNHQLNIVKD